LCVKNNLLKEKNMENLVEKVGNANLILVPKGDDNRPCIQAFEEATDIAVPEFIGRELEAKTGNLTFIKVKGADVPRLIAAGYGDIGITGSDSCEDYLVSDSGIEYQTFGELMCRFALMALAAKVSTIRRQLESNEGYMTVATSYPRLLNKYAQEKGLKLMPTDFAVAGSVEIMPRLLDVPLVADLVSSGVTARDNGLVEIMSLSDVYPALVTRSNTKPELSKPVSYLDIERIDATFGRRGLQINDLATNSYTLNLMRDVNKAGKKAGEEFSEVQMAIFGDGSIEDCENEIADLIYAQMVAAYSRDKSVKLGNIMRVLIERNRLKD
jgi:ATP phosphoribosyltransferase